MVVATLCATGFPSLPRLRACPPPMRLAETPQLTRPGGLVVRRYGHLDDTPPPACKRLSFGAASLPCFPPDCCCSRRLRRPVPRRCESGVPLVCSGPIARASGCAGAGRRAPSARKRQKRGVERLFKHVSRRALHAISCLPASLPFSRTLAFAFERYFLTEWMRVCVKGGEVRVCPRGGSV